jgi:hypothetical protein
MTPDQSASRNRSTMRLAPLLSTTAPVAAEIGRCRVGGGVPVCLLTAGRLRYSGHGCWGDREPGTVGHGAARTD